MKLFSIVILSMFISKAFGFDWQGHRGARGLYPENSIEAMKAALKFPISTLEMDVIISHDGQVVVSHEPWMNPEICRGPNGKNIGKEKEINLYKLTYAQIAVYDCGSKKYKLFGSQKKIVTAKPLLETVIKEVEAESLKTKRQSVSYSIEIKSNLEDERLGFQPSYKTFTDLVVRKTLTLLNTKRFYIQSFDERVLKYLHERYPQVRVVALKDGSFEAQAYLKNLGFSPQVFSPHYKNLKDLDVKFFHDRKIKVVPWTVNSVKEMKKLIDLGVDGIITDYPNLIASVGAVKCPEDQNYFEGKCVEVPVHALPSQNNPGWACKPGYVQKWFHCQKISRPAHAVFLADGKTWVCKPGYVRYRGKCVKGRKNR